MMTIPYNDPEQLYYQVIEREEPTIVLLGDQAEQWTSLTLSYLDKNSIPIIFLPWDKISDLRLQLELIYYPVLQLWKKGKLISEMVGYKNDTLLKCINSYFSLKTKG
jgi:hypothetical protein